MYVSYINSLLCFCGILYIIGMVNKHFYKILPQIDTSNFFSRKFAIKEIKSLKQYILAKLKIYMGLRKIGHIKETDISIYDLAALSELKQYIDGEMKQYIKKIMIRPTSMFSHSSHIECMLKHGKADLYLLSHGNLIDSITIRFESFSQDKPTLEICHIGNTINTSYTYKIKSKYFRYINPSVKLICDMREIVEIITFNDFKKIVSLQVA